MPQNARIFLVEDEPTLRASFKEWLEAAGHVVVLQATDLSGALSKVGKLEEQQVSVAVLDGNLGENDFTGNDGRIIAEKIRQHCPRVKILCLSLQNYTWADVMFPKANVFSRDGNPLGNAVNAL